MFKLRIAELENRLAEKEKETKDLEVKLFEASFVKSSTRSGSFGSFDEEAPLPAKPKTASRSLFDEEPLPTSRIPVPNNIANRHKV